MIVVNGVVSHSVGIKGTCSPSSHFLMCRPNSSSCGLSFRFAGGVRVGPRMRWNYAHSLCMDPAATLDDLREAVTTLEDAERIARRLFGSAHPLTQRIGGDLRISRGMLRDRETPSANA